MQSLRWGYECQFLQQVLCCAGNYLSLVRRLWVWRYIHIKDLGPKDSGSEGNGAGWRETHAHGVCLFKISVHFLASPARRTTQAHLPGLCTFPLGQGPVQACLPSHPLVHLVEQLVSDCPDLLSGPFNNHSETLTLACSFISTCYGGETVSPGLRWLPKRWWLCGGHAEPVRLILARAS